MLSGSIADRLKPDINRRQKLLTDPSLVVSTFPEALNDPFGNNFEGGDQVGGGSPIDPDGDNVGGGGGGSPAPGPGGDEVGGGSHVDPGGDPVGGDPVTTTEAVNVSVVPHDTYSQYLKEKVLKELDAAIGNNKDVYYRVFNRGPNFNEYTVSTTFPAGEHTEQRLTMGTAMDAGNFGKFGTAKSVQGTIMNKFVMRYFGQVGSNQKTVENTIKETAKQFETNGIANEWTPDTVPENNSFRKSVLFKMWNSAGSSSLTAEQFITKLSSGSLQDGTLTSVPNLVLNYYNGSSSYGGRATLNYINTADEEFSGNTPLGTVGSAFTPANQFPRRDPSYCLDVNESSETEMLRAYVDGYNVTIIYVGLVDSSGAPSTLRDALGDEASVYNTVYNAVQGAATPNNISAVQAAGYTFTTVPTGVREGA